MIIIAASEPIRRKENNGKENRNHFGTNQSSTRLSEREPIACPAAATCLRIAGSYVACSPIGKKIALVQCAASADSTAWVFFGQGPSSNVSTTSPSRRKSWLLKCSNPKPGPPVVSISTTRAIPKALGLLHEVGMAAGIGGA